MTHLNWKRAAVGGLVATGVMTVLALMAPVMGLPPMNIPAMLASAMGGSLVLGWMAHFVTGIVLAVIYGAVFATRLPGPGFARGAAYGLLPWIVSIGVVMPMMGAGIFGGSLGTALGSLMGHVVYGAVLGSIYRTEPRTEPAEASRLAAPRHRPA